MDNQQGNIQWKNIAYSIGVFLGDGHAGCYPVWRKKSARLRYVIGIASMDQEPVEKFKDQVNNFFKTNYKIWSFFNKHGTLRHRIMTYQRSIFDFFTINTDNRWYIPPEIFRADDISKKEMIAGLLDTDGSIAKSNRGKNKAPVWTMSFSNNKLSLTNGLLKLLKMNKIKTGKISWDKREYVTGEHHSVSINLKSFVDSDCYLYNQRKLKKLKSYIDQVCPSETKCAAPIIMGDDIVRACVKA